MSVELIRSYFIRRPVVLGILFAILQTMFFSSMTLLIKLVQDDHHPIDMLLYRNGICTVIALLFLMMRGEVRQIFQADLRRQAIRGGVGTIGMILTFITFSMLPLTEAQSLLFAAPLFVVFLSYPLLGEVVGKYRTGAALVGFFGVILVVQPDVISSVAGGMFGIATALSHACVMIALRWLGRTEKPLVTIFYFSLISFVVVLPLVPFYFVIPTMEKLLYLISMGGVAFLVQFFLTKAYFLAPASIIAPLSYCNLLWAVFIDMVILHVVPSSYTLLGASIIIGCNLFILWRQHKKNDNIEPECHKV